MWNYTPPKPVDVDLMLRRASRRVVLRGGDRPANVLSRRQLHGLIQQAIAETVQRLRDEGALHLAQTEARLATESRRELDALLKSVQDLGTAVPEPEVYLAEDDVSAQTLKQFDQEDLELGRGLDLGSVHVRGCARSRITGQALVNVERNAYLDVRADGFTQSLLRKYGVGCAIFGTKAFVVGQAAFELATLFDKTVRRPLKPGPGSEPEGALLALPLLERVLGRPRVANEICVYSVPGEPADGGLSYLYHQGVLENALQSLGYTPRPMVESQVLIPSEFLHQEYTGIAITCGAGAFNVCLAFKGVPALTFSTSRGGDWVDEQVSKAIGMPVAQVCALKERGMHLFRPDDPAEGAVAIYYRHVLQDLFETFKRKISEADWIPTFTKPVDIVCAGGTAMVGGFLELFTQELRQAQLPVAVGQVRLVQRPLEAVAEGCLRIAQEETRAMEESPATMSRAAVDRVAATVAAPIRRRPSAA